ncbi:hypothetical protein [Hanstruepera ponticola]|uniref:hypothetical protein n=1 Tax=Hanstruepera ponticola TaxID=2042995 RepID=UPI0017854AAA|nr:hypothetical protein [Hanstruepera ponticola]
MDKNDLYRKELLNLLALCKQIEDALAKLKGDFLTHKEEKLVSAINSVNSRDINLFKKSVSDNNYNLGNTKDSVAEEILKNIIESSRENIESVVKGQGVLASLNRLLNYKIANLENVKQMKIAPSIPYIEQALSSNKTLKKQIFDSIT